MYPIFAITNTAKNPIHVAGSDNAAQPMTPNIIDKVKIGFLNPLLSAIVPSTGPTSAIRMVQKLAA